MMASMSSKGPLSRRFFRIVGETESERCTCPQFFIFPFYLIVFYFFILLCFPFLSYFFYLTVFFLFISPFSVFCFLGALLKETKEG